MGVESELGSAFSFQFSGSATSARERIAIMPGGASSVASGRRRKSVDEESWAGSVHQDGFGFAAGAGDTGGDERVIGFLLFFFGVKKTALEARECFSAPRFPPGRPRCDFPFSRGRGSRLILL
jgi:hypothetical protein